MSSLRLAMAACALFACPMLAAPSDGPGERALSLAECIDLAITNNLGLKADRLATDIERFAYTASWGHFDPVLSAGVTHSVLDQPAEFDPKKSGTDAAFNLTTDTASTGLSGHFPTGLDYGLGFSLSSLSASSFFPTNSPTFFSFPPSGIRLTNAYLAMAGITFSQPLLKDSWIDRGRQAIQISRKNLRISEFVYRRQVMAKVAAVETAYYDLVAANEKLVSQRKTAELAARLLADVTRKAGAGQLSAVDLRIAEAGVAGAEATLAAAEQGVVSSRNALRSLVAGSADGWSGLQVVPADPLLALPVDTDVRTATDRALLGRPEVAEMKLALEKEDIVVRFASNQRLPSLNIVGSYGWQAWDPSADTAMSAVRDHASPVYSVGVVLSIPIGNISARNKYKASLAARSQTLLKFQQLQQDIVAEVDTAVSAARSQLRQVESTRRGREASEAALALEERLFGTGVVTTYNVVEFQRTLAAARLAEINALADYNTAVARLELATASTLDHRNIQIRFK